MRINSNLKQTLFYSHFIKITKKYNRCHNFVIENKKPGSRVAYFTTVCRPIVFLAIWLQYAYNVSKRYQGVMGVLNG